jgi:hypothetical protein
MNYSWSADFGELWTHRDEIYESIQQLFVVSVRLLLLLLFPLRYVVLYIYARREYSKYKNSN